MAFILNTLSRSSWGVLPAHSIIGLAVLAVAAVLAWFLLRASWRPGAWRGERGSGPRRGAASSILLVVVILVIVFAVLPLHR
jgi:hypothetical protein